MTADLSMLSQCVKDMSSGQCVALGQRAGAVQWIRWKLHARYDQISQQLVRENLMHVKECRARAGHSQRYFNEWMVLCYEYDEKTLDWPGGVVNPGVWGIAMDGRRDSSPSTADAQGGVE